MIGRTTRQRQAVSDMLADLDGFHSAQEIHDLLKDRGEAVGLSTVYRNLQTMADGDEVDVLRTGDGEALYRQCSDGHHHHLVCRACGRTIEVAGRAVERWAGQIASEHGFTEVSHTVEVFGTCAACSRAGAVTP